MSYLKYENLTNEFPYVVIRLMATVYERRRVIFSPRIESADKRSFHIQWFEKLDRSKPLPSDAEEELIRLVKDASSTTRFRMCIVLSETESLYVEPDGGISLKSSAPSGGIALSSTIEVPKPPPKRAN